MREQLNVEVDKDSLDILAAESLSKNEKEIIVRRAIQVYLAFKEIEKRLRKLDRGALFLDKLKKQTVIDAIREKYDKITKHKVLAFFKMLGINTSLKELKNEFDIDVEKEYVTFKSNI